MATSRRIAFAYEKQSSYKPSETGSKQFFSQIFLTENMTVLVILFVVIVVGNSAVLAALLLSKSRKKRMNFFIMQLAISDLLVGLISVTTDVAWKITVSWNAGLIACKLIRYFQSGIEWASSDERSRPFDLHIILLASKTSLFEFMMWSNS
ncbi:unnamed protein product [Notodromas monacha]|uniref:G-protein coupled receptors family 1 profile domain-containing protein n=1 Tax=Notodromas monacha TaxID=399045 RepID=A0A7R9BCZ4_9CRUS|nr:unnamed protein product [Notodromas monacha]CAG0913066.1 unnamed protein product [Notodromas monacha]